MNNAWIVFRLDTQVKKQPIDIYFVLDVASDQLLAFETVATELSQVQADMLLKAAQTKGSSDTVILTKGDPAQEVLQQAAQQLGINFATRPASEIEEFVRAAKKSFGEHFFSTASLPYDVTEEEEGLVQQMFPDSYDLCSCGSGKQYKYCCKVIVREIAGAMVAAEDGNFEEALEWLDKARHIVGDTAEVLCRESIVYSFFDEEKSKKLLAQSLELNPKHPRAHYLRGIMLKQQGDYVGAVREYQLAIANYPTTDHYHLNEVYNNLGVVLHAMGDVKNARIAWEKAVLLVPTDDMARKNLTELIYKEDKHLS